MEGLIYWVIKMKVYKARVGAPFKPEHAQLIGEFINNLPEKTPGVILAQIKNNPGHPIFNYITWDKDKAAYQYQIQQVRNIVNHLILEIREIPVEPGVRAFVSIKSDDQVQYMNVETVLSDTVLRNQIIRRATTELRNWMARYSQYTEFQHLIKSINANLDNVVEGVVLPN